MTNGFFQRACALILTVAMLAAGTPATGHAGIVDTATFMESSQRDADLARLSAGLNRAEVRERLAEMGVNAAAIDARLATLTDAELRQMADKMDQLPAGGDGALTVIGIVFVVLLILEFVGVIDIFKKA